MTTETKVEELKSDAEETLSREIRERADEIMAEMKADHDEVDGKKNNTPSEEEVSDDDTPEDEDVSGEDEDSVDKATEPKDDEKTSVPDDALLSRAVKLGIDLSKAKKSDADLLEHICDQMESVNKKDDAEKKDEKDDSIDSDIDEVLNSIPDLTEDEDGNEYNEDFSKFAKAMKDVVGKLLKENKELKAANAQGRQHSFFESKVAGLDETLSKALKDNPEKRDALSKKFSILEAGYEKLGEKIDKDAIFNEAVSMTLGDVRAKAAEETKKEKLASREKQFIQKPNSSKSKPKEDALTEVAKNLDKKYFGKS